MKKNYQSELERILQEETPGKRLLLHSCCAPCSSYVIEYLSAYFRITVFYYNPNITEENEYRHRAAEQMRLIHELPARYPVSFLEGVYEPSLFLSRVKGLESAPEGGARCVRCFALRLQKSAEAAKEGEYDYFTTTLTISPLKNTALINEIGCSLGNEYGVTWLPCDFKKKNGYKRSIELSSQYHLYRQNYCGCVFSKR